MSNTAKQCSGQTRYFSCDLCFRVLYLVTYSTYGLGDRTTIREWKDENRETDTKRQRRKTEKIIRVSSLSTVITDMCELLDSGFLDRESVPPTPYQLEQSGPHTDRRRRPILHQGHYECFSPLDSGNSNQSIVSWLKAWSQHLWYTGKHHFRSSHSLSMWAAMQCILVAQGLSRSGESSCPPAIGVVGGWSLFYLLVGGQWRDTSGKPTLHPMLGSRGHPCCQKMPQWSRTNNTAQFCVTNYPQVMTQSHCDEGVIIRHI